MTARTRRLRNAVTHLGLAMDDLRMSLDVTPANHALVESIRTDRQQILEIITAIERAEAAR